MRGRVPGLSNAVALGAPLLSLVWMVVLLWRGIVWSIPLHDDEILLLWHGRHMPWLRWPVLLLTLTGTLLLWRCVHQKRSGKPCLPAETPAPTGWPWRLAPLIWAPLPVLPALFADLLPRELVANGLFFGQAFVIAWLGHRLYEAVRTPPADQDNKRTARMAWALALLGTLAYGYGGYYFSTHAGEHLGDEGHYIIQAQSLYEDGDLDIRNNLPAEALQRHGLGHFHVAASSRPPHYYSWHPIGLPLLAFPLWPWGMAGRHVLLGLIAGAGLAGIFLLSLQGGTDRRAALAVTLAVGSSAFWTLYAFRFLPETMGATMLVWAFWGVAAQRRRPWMATFVAGLMNAYLPFAHTRFIPLSLMAFGFFGLEGLWGASPESWPRRLWRLTMFTLICFTGYAAYYHMQTRMFSTGSSYEIEGTLFSYWPGAWHVFADRRGAVPLTPLLYWMIPAACLWPLKDRTRPFLSAGLVLTFLACVLTSCTNRVSVGGASVQGRYLLVVFPLLAPGTAASLQYVLRSRERFLFMSLAALSALPLFWLLYWVPDTGSVFTQPLGTLAQQPLFQGLFKPYLHREVVYAPAWTNWLAGFFPLLALLAMAIILGWNKRAGWLLLTVALALAVAVHAAVTPARLPARPERVAALLERTNLARARTDRRPGRITRDFFHLARTPYRDFHLHAPYTLLSEPLPDAIPPVFSIHALPLNDWDGRPYRWFTLTAPHPPAPGTWIIHIAGTLEGRARLHFAAKEGRHVLVETEIPQHEGHWRLDQVIEPHGKRGDLYLLLRVEAEDEWACRMKHLYRARFHPRMLAEANLDLHTIPAQHSDQNSNP